MSKKLSNPPPPLSREDRPSPPPAPTGIAATTPGIALPCGCIVNMDGRTSYCEAHRETVKQEGGKVMSSPCDVCKWNDCEPQNPPCAECCVGEFDQFELAPKYAAGPDMLEALELVVAVDGPDRTYQEMRSTMEQVRLALAKAKTK